MLFTPPQQQLYRAMCRANRLDHGRRRLVVALDVLVAAASVVSASANHWSLGVGAIGLIWLIVRELPWFMRIDDNRRQAVRLQEQLDCAMGIPSRPAVTGDDIPQFEIDLLASAWRHAVPADYFVDTEGLPNPQAALVRQEQVAIWGEVLHRAYARTMQVGVSIAIALGFVAFLGVDARFSEATLVYAIPLAPLLVGRVQVSVHHLAAADLRAQVRKRCDHALADPAASNESVRSIQDQLFFARLEAPRVPAAVYAWLRRRMGEQLDKSSEARVRSLS